MGAPPPGKYTFTQPYVVVSAEVGATWRLETDELQLEIGRNGQPCPDTLRCDGNSGTMENGGDEGWGPNPNARDGHFQCEEWFLLVTICLLGLCYNAQFLPGLTACACAAAFQLVYLL